MRDKSGKVLIYLEYTGLYMKSIDKMIDNNYKRTIIFNKVCLNPLLMWG